jgi:hypothetical protein
MPDPYRCLITGSRDWSDQDVIWQALADVVRQLPPDQDLVLVHGMCPTGADAMADDWAVKYGAAIERHRAEHFGPWPACGPRRNAYMVHLGADVCYAFIGPCTGRRCRRPEPHGSHGATGCADLAEQAGIETRRFTA